MRWKVESFVVAAAIAVLGPAAVAPGAAHADPNRNAGCKSVAFKQTYGVGGATAYGQERSFRFCWTGGPVMQSKIYSVTGDANCWSNLTFQDRNCKGPTNSKKVPISSAQSFADGSVHLYFWFQSRNCATGPLNLVCSGWSWHGAKYLVKQGGGVILVDADV